jgi:hypothetical protein
LVNAQGETVALPNNGPSTPPSLTSNFFPHILLSSFTPLTNECSYDLFSQVMAAGTTLVDDLRTDIPADEALQVRYQLDLLTITRSYESCFAATVQLLSSSEISLLVPTQLCPYADPTSPLALNDPCCNPDILPLSCCVPYITESNVSFYSVNYSSPQIAAQCAHVDCATSFLDDFAKSIDAQQDPKSSCASTFTSEDADREIVQALKVASQCREKSGYGAYFQGVSCNSDAECQEAFNVTCDFQNHRCAILNLTMIEDMYLQCYLAAFSDTSILPWIRRNLLPPSAQNLDWNTPEFLHYVRDAATAPDCLGSSPFDLTYRSQFSINLLSAGCGQTAAFDSIRPRSHGFPKRRYHPRRRRSRMSALHLTGFSHF